MNFLDLLIAIPIGYLIYKGYRRGIIFELVSLSGVILGSILAVRCANWFSNLLGLDGPNAFLISFFVIFVAVVIASVFIAKLAEKFVKLIHVGFFNNLAGALLGVLKGLCIVGVLLYYVAIFDINNKVITTDVRQSSMLYRPVVKTGSHLVGKMSVYMERRRQIIDNQES